MDKQEFDLKIKNAKSDVKSEGKKAFRFPKKLAALIATIAISSSMVLGLAACNDKQNIPVTPVDPTPPIVTPVEPDKPTPTPPTMTEEERERFNMACENVNNYFAQLQEKQNFTNTQSGIKYEYANGATKITFTDETLYYQTKDDVAYEIYSDGSEWKAIEKQNPSPIDDVLNVANNIAWEKLEDGYLYGSKTLDNKTLALNLMLDFGIATYNCSYNGNTYSGTISKVGTTNFQVPKFEIENEPEQPPIENIDWDNLTEAELQQITPVIVENIKTKLEYNIRRNIGLNGSTLNNIFAIDFDGNNLILGLNYSTEHNQIGLFSYELNSEVNLKSLYENNFSPVKATGAGTQLITFGYDTYSVDNTAKVQQCFAKLANDGLVNNLQEENDFWHMATGGGGVDTALKCGVTQLNLYKISSQCIKYISLYIKSDGNTQDFITDHLINGTLNSTYRKVNEYEYTFTNKALYNFAGLENITSQESEN